MNDLVKLTESGIDFGSMWSFYQTVIFVNGMPCNMNVNIMCKGRLKSLNDYSKKKKKKKDLESLWVIYF